ncbi:DUF7716 domain-containing protein [Pseudomonas sp. M47T1]|uniref:DUF7716 domain-containing protein n=1 Tax=Pseudomonas sp. M47T1 TaxID=1179778 RepID=UPI0005BE4123|nr:hypothetical protein [Pseudomonas sp. M47T1]
MFYTEKLTLDQLINNIRKNEKSLAFCVYGSIPSENAKLSTPCVIDDYPEITDDDDEVFPDTVTEAKLHFWFRDELLEDVISNATMQNPKVTNEEILAAINYYDEHDTFMPLT